jgi:hypothetical protein
MVLVVAAAGAGVALPGQAEAAPSGKHLVEGGALLEGAQRRG